MIPQNEGWIEKLAEFVKEVYDHHKHIKLLGCQFGSQLIAYALGGDISRLPKKTPYIGKFSVCMKHIFFKQPWVLCQTE